MVIAFFVFVESITRLLDPPNINTDMLTVSMVQCNGCLQLITDIQSGIGCVIFIFIAVFVLCSRCLLEAYWSTWWVYVLLVTLTPTVVKAAHLMTMDTRTTATPTASTATGVTATPMAATVTVDMGTLTQVGVEE